MGGDFFKQGSLTTISYSVQESHEPSSTSNSGRWHKHICKHFPHDLEAPYTLHDDNTWQIQTQTISKRSTSASRLDCLIFSGVPTKIVILFLNPYFSTETGWISDGTLPLVFLCMLVVFHRLLNICRGPDEVQANRPMYGGKPFLSHRKQARDVVQYIPEHLHYP